METLSILLDTDIGTDIDDAVALAYLLRQLRCELLGISTVSGEPEKRASLADAVCQAGGRADVPIHVGAEAPLLVAQRQPKAAQAEMLLSGAFPCRVFGKENTAVAFLRETIRARPGEVTLLAIGPLTNIALLFALDPEIPALLKGLTIMGGWYFERPQPEHNIRCDPHAAAMVFAAPIPRLTAVGIDVTGKCVLPADECRRRFTAAGGPFAPVAAFAEVWFRHARHITFHDPLAAALLFEPSLCGLERHRVAVNLSADAQDRGRTSPVWQDGPGDASSPHALAATVNRAAFFTHFFDTAGG